MLISPLLRIFFRIPPTIGMYCTLLVPLRRSLKITSAASRPSSCSPSCAAFMHAPYRLRRSAASRLGSICTAVTAVRMNRSTGIAAGRAALNSLLIRPRSARTLVTWIARSLVCCWVIVGIE